MGLIGGIARTAVAAGTWTAVSNRVNRRQYNRWAEQEQQQYYQQPQQQQYYQQPQQQQYYQQPQQQQYYQQPGPAPTGQAPAPGSSDQITQLKQLADLKSQGILTEEEFAAQKAKILAS